MNSKVESFNIDHTKMIIPFIRVAGLYKDKDTGCYVTKFDLRFVQPNKDELDSSAIHSIEHLLAVALREMPELQVIDFSPMGCKTGFYMTVFTDWTDEANQQAFKKIILTAILRAIDAPLEAANEVQCGNYKLHDPQKAKEYLRNFYDAMNK